MKKWSGGAIIIFLIFILLLQYTIFQSPLSKTSLTTILSQNNTDQNPISWLQIPNQNPSSTQNPSIIIPVQSLFSTLLNPNKNISEQETPILHTWNLLKHLTKNTNQLPHGFDAIKEANDAWYNLLLSIQEEKSNPKIPKNPKQQCPYSIRHMNTSGLTPDKTSIFSLKVPCGMVQGSSLTIIGTPEGVLGEFKVDLLGGTGPGEPYTPILLHYNVRLGGDKLTEEPVIVQNTWTVNDEWGNEERCPPDSDFDETAKVDGFPVCNEIVGKEEKQNNSYNKHFNISRNNFSEDKKYFPFIQNHLAIAIFRVGVEGIHMTVDGKHITSFAFRESLEPWLASEVRITGEIKLLSVIASGLPTSEKILTTGDLQLLKAPAVPFKKSVDLFIGVFSNANNFKRRMAIRRTWMQFDHVRSGSVVVRFFVGLHKNQIVNEELWREASTYGDIQLMPFVDYYSLITWKTIAICVFGTNIVSAKYVMKTDDDAFIRVPEILSSLKRINITNGLLYGKINFESQPHRDPDSKWHITPEEWPEENYPPWAHGPGYIISRNIAKMVYKRHKKGRLKMFKLEDVAMGIWIDEIKKGGTNVEYINEDRIFPDGCEMDYLLAHYQEPRDMLCLWEKLQTTKRAWCCSDK